MRSNTQSVTIDASPKEVLAFVSDPANLPLWALGFAQQIRNVDGSWIVTTPEGEVTVRVETDHEVGTVDFVMSPAPGIEVTANSRVLSNEDGTEYVFTQFQAPGMPDEVFDGQIKTLGHEFAVLKDLVEG